MFGVKILEEKKSKFNGDLKVIRALGLGTYIQAGNLTQSGGIVETFWKQTIKKIKSGGLKVDNCLILGLGGGTLVKVINRYWPIAKISGVDIDPVIIELGQKYLKSDFSTVNIKIIDALTFTRSQVLSSKTYNLIIVDLYNGDQFPKKFESGKFLGLINKLLQKDGVVVFNRLYYKEKKIKADKFEKRLVKAFKTVKSFRPISNIMFICLNN